MRSSLYGLFVPSLSLLCFFIGSACSVENSSSVPDLEFEEKGKQPGNALNAQTYGIEYCERFPAAGGDPKATGEPILPEGKITPEDGYAKVPAKVERQRKGLFAELVPIEGTRPFEMRECVEACPSEFACKGSVSLQFRSGSRACEEPSIAVYHADPTEPGNSERKLEVARFDSADPRQEVKRVNGSFVFPLLFNDPGDKIIFPYCGEERIATAPAAYRIEACRCGRELGGSLVFRSLL